MAGQEDALRMAVEIVDKYSGPLREMTKEWQKFSDLIKFGQERAGKDNKEQTRLQGLLPEQMKDTGRTASGILSPAMEAMGCRWQCGRYPSSARSADLEAGFVPCCPCR